MARVSLHVTLPVPKARAQGPRTSARSGPDVTPLPCWTSTHSCREPHPDRAQVHGPVSEFWPGTHISHTHTCKYTHMCTRKYAHTAHTCNRPHTHTHLPHVHRYTLACVHTHHTCNTCTHTVVHASHMCTHIRRHPCARMSTSPPMHILRCTLKHMCTYTTHRHVHTCVHTVVPAGLFWGKT